jgi:hypothetical protein
MAACCFDCKPCLENEIFNGAGKSMTCGEIPNIFTVLQSIQDKGKICNKMAVEKKSTYL